MFWIVATCVVCGFAIFAVGLNIGFARGFDAAEKIWKPHGEQMAKVYRDVWLDTISKINK